jgi:hypothetical protein
LIGSLRFEDFHGIVAGKCRVVDSGHKGSQSGVIIECAKLMRNVNKFLDLLGTSFGSIMAQDKGHHPAYIESLLQWKTAAGVSNPPISELI